MNEQVAMNMREIADKANEERQKQVHQVADQWVEFAALPAIKKSAELGGYHLDIQVPTSVHKVYAEENLSALGFQVEQFGREYNRYIRVKW